MMKTGDNNSDVDKVFALLVSDTVVVLDGVVGSSVEVDVDTDVEDEVDADVDAVCCGMISEADCAFLMNSMTSSRSSEELLL